MPDLFVHPLTGEVLEADEEALLAATISADREISRLYRARDVLLAPLTEIRGPAVLPEPTQRTSTQKMIARCPRCGKDLSDD